MLPLALDAHPVSTGLMSPFLERGNQGKTTFISLLPGLSPTTHPPSDTLREAHFDLLEEMCGSCSPLQTFLLSHTALLPPKHRGLSLQNLSLHLVNPVNPITGGGGGNLTKYVIHIRLLHLGLYLLLTSQIEMLPTSLAKSCHLQCPSPVSFF